MQLGMVGLGRMGANIVRRIMRDGHTAVALRHQRRHRRRSWRRRARSARTDLEEFVAQAGRRRASRG